MSGIKMDQDELPEYFGVFTLTHALLTAAGTGLTVLAKAGHHPKCRLVVANLLTTVANASSIDITIEDGDGNDAAVCTGSTTAFDLGTVVYSYSQIFERNEAIVAHVLDAGTSAGALLMATFESID